MVPKLKYKVSYLDQNFLLYGNFIGLQYIFSKPLNAAALVATLNILVTQFPALSGHYDEKAGCIRPHSFEIKLNQKRVDSDLNSRLNKKSRLSYVSQPDRNYVMRGKAPLSTFTLTEFSGGGTVLGIAISHLLTDADGFHKLIKHFINIYKAVTQKSEVPPFPFLTDFEVFQFGTQKRKSQIKAELKNQALPKPIPIKGLIGSFIKSAIQRAMDKILTENVPVCIHFTPEDVTRLKQTVLKQSGEDWISTNIALCAHFTKIMGQLSYKDAPVQILQIGQLLNLRNRYFTKNPEGQENYLGNAILIHIEKTEFPKGLQNTSIGELGQYFRRRQSSVTSERIKAEVDLLSDCLRLGYTNPALDFKKPVISLNNQSKMNVYDIDFDGQRPIKVIPQDVGDNIMFFPASDGGIDIYIRDLVNPVRQEELLKDVWRKLIFAF